MLSDRGKEQSFGWILVLTGRNLAGRKANLLLSVAQNVCYPIFCKLFAMLTYDSFRKNESNKSNGKSSHPRTNPFTQMSVEAGTVQLRQQVSVGKFLLHR
jgi:hypothetical protein